MACGKRDLEDRVRQQGLGREEERAKREVGQSVTSGQWREELASLVGDVFP